MDRDWRFSASLETETNRAILSIFVIFPLVWFQKHDRKGLVKTLDRRADILNTFTALLIESSGGAGPVKLRQPDPIFGWGC